MPSPALILNDPPNKTRADYANLSTVEILREIEACRGRLVIADNDHEIFAEEFAIQEYRAVLQERGDQGVRLFRGGVTQVWSV